MKVSIIIPVYNVEKYLKKCLDSIINQTYKNLEIIIVNDGSKDNSEKIIKEYNDDRIVYIKQKNAGQAVARNKALKKATGNYVYFIDSDDYIAPNAMEILVKTAEEKQADIVCHKSILEYEDHLEPMDSFIQNNNKIKQFILSHPSPWAKLIRTELIVKNKLFFLENHVYEDVAVVPSYALFAKKIVFINDELYYYVQRLGSTMNQQKYNKKFEDIFDALENLNIIFEKYDKTNKYKEELEFIYIEHLLHGSALRFLKYDEGKESLKKITNIIKEKYPNYKNNKYLKKQNLKYRVVCNLFYKRKYKTLKLILKK